MELTGTSTIEDILEQDLPRTKIFKDIFNAIAIPYSELMSKNFWLQSLDNRSIEDQMKSYPCMTIEDYFNFWITLENGLIDYNTGIDDSIFFVFGLLLPYYYDIESYKLDIKVKRLYDIFRPETKLTDDSLPHPIALHHAHNVKDIIIEGLIKYPSRRAQKNTEQKKARKDKFEIQQKKYLYESAFDLLHQKNTDLTQKELDEKIYRHLLSEYPNYFLKYTETPLKHWLPRLIKGERIYNRAC